MACGKTTLGEALQEAFPGLVEFVDLDREIEREAGDTVAAIFANRGEDEFRRLEAAALRRLAGRNDSRRLVVACGGGTPCHGDNMDLMLTGGTVVWLQASPERTVARILEAGGQRPLVAGMDAARLREYIDSHMATREPHYSRAHLTFDSTRLDTPREIAETVRAFATDILKI